MKYPFEKEKNDIHFKYEKDNELFIELKSYVNSLQEEEVDKWFIKNEKNLKRKGKENLSKAIGTYTYYFSISSKNINSLEKIRELESKQQLMLLKHFKFKEQALILNQQDELKDSKIIEVLYITAKKENKKNKFFNSRVFLDVISKMFSEDEFNNILEIEKIIEKRIDTIEVNKIAFYQKNSASYYSKLNNNYAISDEIILNYNDKKRDFLLERNVELPTKEKALKLLEDITQEYKERDYMTPDNYKTLALIAHAVNNYYKVISYYYLNEKLANKQKTKLIKI